MTSLKLSSSYAHALGHIVHSLAYLSYKGVHDLSISLDFLSSLHSSLSKQNSSPCLVYCDSEFFKVYVVFDTQLTKFIQGLEEKASCKGAQSLKRDLGRQVLVLGE